MSPRETQTNAITSQIKAGYVLHIDPDYLLLTYGERVVFGPMSPGVIGARYALCLGVEKDVTFWSLLTSQNNIHSQEVPEEAKVGAWKGSGRPTYMAKDQVWMATREMIIEAHLQANTIKSSFRHSYVVVGKVAPWPAIPCTFPTDFPKIDRIRPEDRTALDTPEASVVLPDYFPGIFRWGTWMQQQRLDVGVSVCGLVKKLGIPGLDIQALQQVESEHRLMSVHELAMWTKSLGLQGEKLVRQIPTRADEPPAALDVAEIEAEPDAASYPERTVIADRAMKLLLNTRLTDEEAHWLVQSLEQSTISILLGA